MPQGPAARIRDNTAHGIPLSPGPGSVDTFIGNKPAWRALPAGAGAGLQSFNSAADATMKSLESATKAAAPTPGAGVALAAETAGKAALSTGGAALAAGLAASGADQHICSVTTPPVPIPHGPGFVIDGSSTVLINNLPASRQGDTVMEVIGGPDKIVLGEPTVLIGG
ncbi:MAG: hypothetical protein FJW30_15165 [Acidobacteria bacterium]|nr:hypothetical protein [Acidobacteriota bacterium]